MAAVCDAKMRQALCTCEIRNTAGLYYLAGFKKT
jgi:hypothetical protein